MQFCEKLHLLMSIFGTTNNHLAAALNIDPSLVSRWRNGRRIPSSGSGNIEAIADYFVRQAKMDYQRAAIIEVVGPAASHMPCSSSELSSVLVSWLSYPSTSDTFQGINNFVNRLNSFNSSTRQELIKNSDESPQPFPVGRQSETEVFFGIQGKRDAVVRFLSMILASPKLYELLLMSEEDMEWLTGDKEYYQKWSELLMRVIMKGNRIKIIHTINRNTSELLSVIDKWLPLHLTGLIETYYFPKYRESAFKRTMFIAPGLAAVTSTCVNNRSLNTSNYLLLDKNVICSVSEDFHSYLSECRQLIKLYGKEHFESFCDMLVDFEEQSGNSISFKNTFSIYTIPEETFKSMLLHSNLDNMKRNELLTMYRNRIDSFRQSIRYNSLSEIVVFPSLKTITQLKDIYLSPFEVLSLDKINYCIESISRHIENVIHLLEKYENYNVFLAPSIISKPAGQNVFLTVKSGLGAIITKSSSDFGLSFAFAFNEPNLTGAFYNYLAETIEEIPPGQRGKKYTIETLKEFVKRLNSPDTYSELYP